MSHIRGAICYTKMVFFVEAPHRRAPTILKIFGIFEKTVGANHDLPQKNKIVGAQHAEPKTVQRFELVGAIHELPRNSKNCRGNPCGCPIKGTACRAPMIFETFSEPDK